MCPPSPSLFGPSLPAPEQNMVSSPLIFPVVMLILLGSGCSSLVGRECALEGGDGQGDVLYEQADPTCNDNLCVSILGSSPYCTVTCSESDDCPSGFGCEEVNLSPTPGVENNALLCVDQTPDIPGDDDDDTVPPGCLEGVWGTAPVLTNLTITPREEGGACSLDLKMHWYDQDGDINGADSAIYFDDTLFQGTFEVADATDLDLTLTVSASALELQTSYDVQVKIRDRGCNWSNTLTQDNYVTPDTSCQ